MSAQNGLTLGELTRVTIRSSRRSIDLVVPTQAPIAEWWPSLLRTVVGHTPAGAPPAVGAVDDGWRLTRADGRPIDPSSGLGAAGIADGELLLLEPIDPDRPAVVVTDVVEELTGQPVARLTLDRRRPWVLGGAAVSAIAAVAITVLATLGSPTRAALPLALLAAVLLGVTALLALRLRDDRAAVVTGLLATVAAATATGVLVVDGPSDPIALLLRPTAVALLTQAVLLGCGPAVRAAATGVIWSLVPVALGALLALVAGLGVGVAAAAAVVLLTLAVPAAPRGAAYLARLTALPGRTGVEVDAPESESDDGALSHRSTHAHRVLRATLLSSVVVLLAMWAVVLSALEAPWSWLVVVASGIAVASTSRSFGRIHHVYLLALAGLAGTAAGLMEATVALGPTEALTYLAWPLVFVAAGLLLAGLDTRLDLPAVGLLRAVRAASLAARAVLPVLLLGSAGVLGWAWSTGMRIGAG